MLSCDAFATSRIDCCNSLYANLPKSTLKLLESVQNFAARLVCRQSLYCHIKPLLKELHWLPVPLRIDFKILLITFKAVHFSVPPYLASQLNFKSTDYNLRHYDSLMLEEHKSDSARMGDRAFAIYAPSLWNKIPYHIRSSSSTNVHI